LTFNPKPGRRPDASRLDEIGGEHIYPRVSGAVDAFCASGGDGMEQT
jgi:hypothetical protein